MFSSYQFPFWNLACSWKNATTFVNVGRLHPSGTRELTTSVQAHQRFDACPGEQFKKILSNFGDARGHGGRGRRREKVPAQFSQRRHEIVGARTGNARNPDGRIRIDHDLLV